MHSRIGWIGPRLFHDLPGYFESPNLSINLYKHPAGQIHHGAMQDEVYITIMKLNDEILLLIPDPASIADTSEAELLDVSDRELSSLYHSIRRSELNTAKASE